MVFCKKANVTLYQDNIEQSPKVKLNARVLFYVPYTAMKLYSAVIRTKTSAASPTSGLGRRSRVNIRGWLHDQQQQGETNLLTPIGNKGPSIVTKMVIDDRDARLQDNKIVLCIIS